MHIHLLAAVAALAFTGAAAAQSHSVTNMANPPQKQSDTKAGTEATPGKTATAHRNTSKQPDKNAGQARNARQAGKDGGKAATGGSTSGSSSGSSSAGASGGAMTGERLDAGSSATATTGIGAGNGDHGAEGAMEIKPSDAYVNPVERRALDEAPKSGKK